MADAHVLSQEYADQLLFNTVVQLTETVFGIFGNLIVLLIYTKYVQDKTVTRYFIPILALVDLAGCLSNSVQFYLDDTMAYVYPSVFLCKTISFSRILTGGLSANIILTIALQRYLMICRPLGKQMSQTSCRVSILLMFLFSVGYSAPVLKLGDVYHSTITRDSGNTTRNISTSVCHISKGDNDPKIMVAYFGTLLLLSFINIVVTSVLYIPVTMNIYRRLLRLKRNQTIIALDGDTDNTSQSTQTWITKKVTLSKIPRQNSRRTCIESTAATTNNKYRKEKSRKNINTMFLVIIIVYVVSYLTSLVTHVHLSATDIQLRGYELNIYYFCLRSNLLNHIANPYIYWIFDIKYRNELRKLCCHETMQRCSFSILK